MQNLENGVVLEWIITVVLERPAVYPSISMIFWGAGTVNALFGSAILLALTYSWGNVSRAKTEF